MPPLLYGDDVARLCIVSQCFCNRIRIADIISSVSVGGQGRGGFVGVDKFGVDRSGKCPAAYTEIFALSSVSPEGRDDFNIKITGVDVQFSFSFQPSLLGR